MIEVVIFILLCLIWGSTWLAIKIGLEGAPPFLGSSLRFILSTAALFLFVRLSRRWDFSFMRRWPGVIGVGIVLYPLPYGLVYWGTQYVESGMAAVLFAIMPFFVALLAHRYIAGERLTICKIAGMILGFSGIVVIFAGSLGAKGALGMLAMAAIAASSFFSSLGTIIMKRRFHDVDPVAITAVHSSVGAVGLGLIGLIFESPSAMKLGAVTLGAIAYLGIFGTAIAFSLYFFLLKKTEATKLSTIAFITPVVALILGAIVRNEVFDTAALIGSLMVLAGVYIVVVKGKKSRVLSAES